MGTEVHAVGGIDAPLQAGKGIDGVLVGVAERGIVLDGGVDEFGVGEVLVQAFDAVIPELGFDAAEAALDPLGGDEGVDERELRGIVGWQWRRNTAARASSAAGSSPGMMWDQASMPDLRALSEEMALPSEDLGPADFWALRRLALIWASVGMVSLS